VAAQNVSIPIADATPYLPPVSTFTPPYQGNLSGIVSDLKLPRSYQWNLALEKALGDKQSISATYVAQAGKKLLRLEAFAQPNGNFTSGSVLQLTTNSATSNYQALQAQYRRRLLNGLQMLANYTWSHSIDNSSADQVAFFSDTAV